jgi:hypothetical protein
VPGRSGNPANGERLISNVVLMGMGEPLANLDNTVTALRLMLDDNAYGLSRRRVTVSTSGLVPAMDRLRDECAVALAVSLHAPNDGLRDQLVPINRKYPLRELLAACRRYLEKAPRDFVTFEYVMLDGVNDADAQARELLALTREVPCKFNLIPFNPFPGSPYRRSPAYRIRRFAEDPARGGGGDHNPQDARRRHRCRLWSTGWTGARQNAADWPANALPSARPSGGLHMRNAVLALLVCLCLGACSSVPLSLPSKQQDPEEAADSRSRRSPATRVRVPNCTPNWGRCICRPTSWRRRSKS